MTPNVILESSRHSLDEMLWVKAASGSLEQVKELLAVGASPNAQSGIRTALMAAVERGYAEVAHTLVDAGADVNTSLKVSGEQLTALFYAILAGEPEMVEYLISKGADIHVLTNQGRGLLGVAVLKGIPGTVDALIAAGADVNFADPAGETPLMLAAKGNSVEIVDKLIAAQANPDQRHPILGTALHYAISHNNAPAAASLIAAGANLEAIEDKGMTPLMDAASLGHTGCAELLIQAGASLLAVDAELFTPLLHAIFNKRPIDLYLSEGCINLPDLDGYTPLMWAAQTSKAEHVQKLLDAGADPLVTHEGLGALVFAKDRECRAVLENWLLGTRAESRASAQARRARL